MSTYYCLVIPHYFPYNISSNSVWLVESHNKCPLFIHHVQTRKNKYLQDSPTVYHDISIKNTIERFFVVSGEITTSSWLLVGWLSPNILISYIYTYIYISHLYNGLYKKPLPFCGFDIFWCEAAMLHFPNASKSSGLGRIWWYFCTVVQCTYKLPVWYRLISFDRLLYRVYTYKFIADDGWWRSTIGISGYLFTINYTKEQMHIQYRFSHSLLVLAWVQRVHFRWRVEFAAMWMRSEGRVPEAITEWASHWTTCLKYRLQAFAPLKIF